ncbi:MAG: transcriptional regulator, partial [Burkholderiaceae bacterium]
LEGVAPALLEGAVNVLRLSLHPDGLAPRIANLRQWRAHLLERLRQQIEASADPVLAALRAELQEYPEEYAQAGAAAQVAAADYAGVAVPLQLRSEQGLLSFISTTTVFGTPVDVTLSELALETFFPADAATAERLRRMAG